MKHPLGRIFAPIGMIVFIAASSVLVAVDDFDVVGLQSSADSISQYDAESLENVVARQDTPVR